MTNDDKPATRGGYSLVPEVDCLSLVLQAVPGFRDRWNAERDCHATDDGSVSSCGVMTVLGEYFRDSATDSTETAAAVLSLAESLLESAHLDVQNAVQTCFLENLLNYWSAGTLAPDHFVPFLGPHSREFCRRWDEFTGVKTPGLWNA